jgi:branched-subunit amino acid transport protein AzlD
MTNTYVLEAFLVMAAATYATRLFPFLIPKKHRTNTHLQFIGRNFPPAVMLLLVIYCLKGTRFGSAPYGVPEMAAVLLVVGVHLLKRNALFSIALGTACYMCLVQTTWLGNFFSTLPK